MATKQIHVLWGDKKKGLEAEEHFIKFPGGYIAVMRCSDGKYWAHIGVQSPAKGDPKLDDLFVESKHGIIEAIRVDRHNQTKAVELIEVDKNMYHFAVLIKTE